MAERSYPSPRSGAAAGRSYPASEVRGGWEKPPHIQGQGRQPRGATPSPRSGVAAERSHYMLEVRAVAERSYHMPEVR